MPTTGDSETRTGSQAIERALAIMTCFGPEHTEISLTELSRATDLRVSTAHRIASALVRGGFLARDTHSERYQLGPRLAILGQTAMAQYGLMVAQPLLQELADATGEAVSLGVRDGGDVVVALRVESSQPLRFDRPAGSRVRLHASAMGKALLAFALDDVKTTVQAIGKLERFTPKTLTQRAALVASLDQARRVGYAINDEERHEGVRGLGAPILDRSGVARAAVAIQGPVNRLTPKRLADLGPCVVATADRLAAVLPLDRL